MSICVVNLGHIMGKLVLFVFWELGNDFWKGANNEGCKGYAKQDEKYELKTTFSIVLLFSR